MSLLRQGLNSKCPASVADDPHHTRVRITIRRRRWAKQNCASRRRSIIKSPDKRTLYIPRAVRFDRRKRRRTSGHHGHIDNFSQKTSSVPVVHCRSNRPRSSKTANAASVAIRNRPDPSKTIFSICSPASDELRNLNLGFSSDPTRISCFLSIDCANHPESRMAARILISSGHLMFDHCSFLRTKYPSH